jgi:hypothetical protein
MRSLQTKYKQPLAFFMTLRTPTTPLGLLPLEIATLRLNRLGIVFIGSNSLSRGEIASKDRWGRGLT